MVRDGCDDATCDDATCDDATCSTSVAGDAPTAAESDSDGSPNSFRTDGTRRLHVGPCGREDCEFVVDGDPDTCAICYEALATADRLRQVKPMVSPLSV